MRTAVREGWASLAARPLRALLTVSGLIFGVAAIVGVAGVAKSGEAAIQRTLDELAPRDMQVRTAQALSLDEIYAAEDGLATLPGVAAVGYVERVPDLVPASHVVGDRVMHGPMAVGLAGLTPATLEALQPDWSWGGGFDKLAAEYALPVAVLGGDAARGLMIRPDTTTLTILIRDREFRVVGVADLGLGGADLQASVLLPLETRRLLIETTTVDQRFVVVAEPNQSEQLRSPIRLIVDAHSPGDVEVVIPEYPEVTRQSISSDLTMLVIAGGGVAALIGALMIATLSSFRVVQRRGEIGLRKAMGATQADIVAMVVSEAAIAGSVAGIVGTVVGSLAAATISYYQEWPIILDQRDATAGLAASLVVGALAGTIPAMRSAKIDAVDAMRANDGL